MEADLALAKEIKTETVMVKFNALVVSFHNNASRVDELIIHNLIVYS